MSSLTTLHHLCGIGDLQRANFRLQIIDSDRGLRQKVPFLSNLRNITMNLCALIIRRQQFIGGRRSRLRSYNTTLRLHRHGSSQRNHLGTLTTKATRMKRDSNHHIICSSIRHNSLFLTITLRNLFRTRLSTRITTQRLTSSTHHNHLRRQSSTTSSIVQGTILERDPLRLLMTHYGLTLFHHLATGSFRLYLYHLSFFRLPTTISNLLIRLFGASVIRHRNYVHLHMLLLRFIGVDLHLYRNRGLHVSTVGHHPNLFYMNRRLHRTNLHYTLFDLHYQRRLFRLSMFLGIQRLHLGTNRLHYILPRLFRLILGSRAIYLRTLSVNQGNFGLLISNLSTLFGFHRTFFLHHRLYRPLQNFPRIYGRRALNLRVLTTIRTHYLFLYNLVLDIRLLNTLLNLLPMNFRFHLNHERFLFHLRYVLRRATFQILSQTTTNLRRSNPKTSVHSLTLFCFRPELCPYNFYVLNLRRLRDLLIYYRMLLILFFRHNRPFTHSYRIYHFPLRLLMIHSNLLVTPAHYLYEGFFNFRATFLFPLNERHNRGIPRLFFLKLGRNHHSRRFLPPHKGFFMALTTHLSLLTLVRRDLYVEGLHSTGHLHTNIHILLHGPETRLTNRLFQPLLHLLNGIRLYLHLTRNLYISNSIYCHTNLFSNHLIRNHLSHYLIQRHPPNLLLRVHSTPRLPINIYYPINHRTLRTIVGTRTRSITRGYRTIHLINLRGRTMLILRSGTNHFRHRTIRTSNILSSNLHVTMFLHTTILPTLIRVLKRVRHHLTTLYTNTNRTMRLITRMGHRLSKTTTNVQIITGPTHRITLPKLLRGNIRRDIRGRTKLAYTILTISYNGKGTIMTRRLITMITMILSLGLCQRGRTNQNLGTTFFRYLQSGQANRFGSTLNILQTLFLFNRMLHRILLQTIITIRLITIRAYHSFLQHSFKSMRRTTIVRPFLRSNFIGDLIYLIQANVRSTSSFSLRTIECGGPLHARRYTSIILSRTSNLRLPMKYFSMLTPYLPIIIGIISMGTSQLVLIIRIRTNGTSTMRRHATYLQRLLQPISITRYRRIRIYNFRNIKMSSKLGLYGRHNLSTLRITS